MSCTQLYDAFVPQKEFGYIHDDTDAFFFFYFFWMILMSVLSLFSYCFSSSESFWYPSHASFWSFSLCFWYLLTIFIYIEKKIIKTCFYWFLYSHSVLNFLHQNFFHQDFLHWKFLHKNLLFQNQKKFLCHQWYTQASLFL